jgi:hypothetical protein
MSPNTPIVGCAMSKGNRSAIALVTMNASPMRSADAATCSPTAMSSGGKDEEVECTLVDSHQT